jgi:hypothetical protein
MGLKLSAGSSYIQYRELQVSYASLLIFYLEHDRPSIYDNIRPVHVSSR